MYKHYILFLEDSDEDKRIAFHKLISIEEDFKQIREMEQDIKKLGIKTFSHLISTKDSSIESIREKDGFFTDVVFLEDIHTFFDIAKNPKKLKAMDVARYILMLKPTSPLKLQKLLYIIYERYYLKTGKPLFEEQFLAFDYGPVVKEVYSAYRGKRELLSEDDDHTVYSISDKAITPITYKILRESDGEIKRDLITEVVDEYKDLSAWDMVEKTHRHGTAWYKAYQISQNQPITFEMIKSAKPTQ